MYFSRKVRDQDIVFKGNRVLKNIRIAVKYYLLSK